MKARWSRSSIAGICILILLGVYWRTMPPTLTWAHYGADGGDLVTAVARRSVPHPPGFPTYLLTGALTMGLPWGTPAWRLNALSAVVAAATGGTVVITTWHLMHDSRRKTPPSSQLPLPPLRGGEGGGGRGVGGEVLQAPAALSAGLALGTAPLFWSQALIAEVYALAALLAALVVYCLLRRRPAWQVGLVWGLGLGTHVTLLALAPLVAWGLRRRRWLQAGGVALLSWGLAYALMGLTRSGVPSPWADLGTPAGWWQLLSADLYRGYVFALPAMAWPQRLLAWFALLVRQFTPIGAVLAGAGLAWLWRSRRRFAGATGLSVGLVSLYAIGYDTADSLVYLVPALPPVALWLGAGLARAAQWLHEQHPWGQWVLILLPCLQLVLFWGQMDVSDDRQALTWAEHTLQAAPAKAALLTAQDAQTFTLWYVHDVLGIRPDVLILDDDLWSLEHYRTTMQRTHALDATAPSAKIAAERANRPVIRVTEDEN